MLLRARRPASGCLPSKRSHPYGEREVERTDTGRQLEVFGGNLLKAQPAGGDLGAGARHSLGDRSGRPIDRVHVAVADPARNLPGGGSRPAADLQDAQAVTQGQRVDQDAQPLRQPRCHPCGSTRTPAPTPDVRWNRPHRPLACWAWRRWTAASLLWRPRNGSGWLIAAERSALDAIGHLVGMQAQEPLEPYVGLWSRLQDFRPDELVELLQERAVVRTLLMRRTLHLVSRGDCLELRPVHDDMLVARMRGTLGRALPGVDFAELAEAGEPLFAETPQTLTEVARAVGGAWPEASTRTLGDALSTLLRLVQVPPRGLWGQQAPARNTTIRAWLGVEPAARPDTLDRLVLRYLRAYGPATSSDLRAWSGLSGLPSVIKRLRPDLAEFRDERGRVLLDVPEGPLPGRETALPPRFLPAFDNAVLGYDDRSRIIDDEHRGLSVAGARFLLVDGRVAGVWASAGTAEAGIEITVRRLRELAGEEEDEVAIEAARLAGFLGDGAAGRVRFE